MELGAPREGRQGPWGDPAVTLCARPQMFVRVAEVMGRHYGMVPIQVRCPFLDSPPQAPAPWLLASAPLFFQHLDLLVRDSSHPGKAGRGHVGDIIQVREGPGRVGGAGIQGAGGVLQSSERSLPLSEILRQVPQSSGAAPRAARPLLPPSCPREAVGEQRPRKPQR